ncbi:MAG TPA: D-alanyl-D-alanine carboxypeptidase/D-alanyl-D-alanine-endopeptidase [Pyrinomonadaceae bacterium]|jgi:D-alanyl-D-alanine carboxypeptidase/D-alanyl-D-alanine-endopeptidase (penicillin-binding protein 4)
MPDMNFNLLKRQPALAFALSAAILLAAALSAPSFLIPQRRQAAPTANRADAKENRARENRASNTEARDASNSAPRDSASDSTRTSEPTQTTRQEREADAALGRDIERLIEESEFARARWGISVVSLRDRRVLYARDSERLLAPASNMKLYTTAVALDLLGADHRWRTSVYAQSEPDRSGTLNSNLTLYGRGAPDLSSRSDSTAPINHLAALAEELYRRGLRRVRGDIVGDESYFRGEPLGDGWQWNDVQWYYGAEVSALSIDDNEITLSVAGASRAGEAPQIRLVPETDYVRVRNDMNTVERGARSTLGVTRALSANDVRVWGDFPVGASPYAVRLSVHQPALRAATLFRDALRRRGIEVEGHAVVRDARVPESERFRPETAVELAFVESRPLAQVVRAVNKESLNLQAELLLRTLGKERANLLPPPADPQRARPRDTDETALAIVRLWLGERAGVETDRLALHDGSGLSRLNLVTPQATTSLLARMSQSPTASLFRDSLPKAAEDGTLRFRLRQAGADARRIVAKTGTLTYIDSLSGYATTADGEPLAFSIICNEETERASSFRLIDRIAALLASHSSRKSQP